MSGKSDKNMQRFRRYESLVKKSRKSMNETKEKDTVLENQIPYIKRKIDGSLYTVKIHFWPDSKETAIATFTRPGRVSPRFIK